MAKKVTKKESDPPKRAKAAAPTKPPPPDHLTMRLFAPGMTALHRAGLGGLACTLKAMERQFNNGLLAKTKLPAPFVDGKPPWDIEEDSITLHFGKPEKAGEYLKKLFEFGFQIREGVIYLPGQYSDPPPQLAVRSELQLGLTLSFLQHGKTRILGEAVPFTVDPDGTGLGTIQIDYRPCSWFKHQNGGFAVSDEKTGLITEKPIEVIGPLNPGAMVRHIAFATASRIEETPAGALCLYFALVGCLALNVSRGAGILLIPDVENLETFTFDRPFLTPNSVRECKVAGASDAVLQSMVRLRAKTLLRDTPLPACLATRFEATAWASQQKSRVDALETVLDKACRVESVEVAKSERMLKQFELALALLPARVKMPAEKLASTQKGKRKTKAQSSDDSKPGFWAESTIRPYIATSLARGRPWYDNLHLLFRNKQSAKYVDYEKRGLQAMSKDRILTDDDEAHFIAAMHRAIFMGRGRIYAETMGAAAAKARAPANNATKKRWEKFMDGLRLGLVGARVANEVQDVINKLLARYGTVKELRDQEAVHLIRGVVFHSDWRRARNLALFALASYVRPAKAEAIAGDTEDAPVEAETN